MSERGPEQEESIFRKEALEHYVNRGTAGDVMRMKGRWNTVGFWGLIATFLAALVLASTVKVNSTFELVGTYSPSQQVLALRVPKPIQREMERIESVEFQVLRKGAEPAELRILKTDISGEELVSGNLSLVVEVPALGGATFFAKAEPLTPLVADWQEYEPGVAKLTMQQPLMVVLFPELSRFS